MVSTSNIAKLPIRIGTDVPSLPASTSEQAVALDPRVVPEFVDVAARDAAYTAAIAGTTPYTTALKGMRCYVHAGPGGYPDWCGWNGSEWIWDNPVPVTYESSSFAGTNVGVTTPSGHIPSLFLFTPSRSGYANVELQVSAQSVVAGYGTGYIRPRFSSGTLLPGGRAWSVIDEHPTGFRQDTPQKYYVPIYLTKGVAVQLAVDLWSAFGSGASWQLNNAFWLITQL